MATRLCGRVRAATVWRASLTIAPSSPYERVLGGSRRRVAAFMGRKLNLLGKSGVLRVATTAKLHGPWVKRGANRKKSRNS